MPKNHEQESEPMAARHIRLPDTLWNALERIGAELDRPPSYVARKALEAYVASYNERSKELERKASKR